MTAAMDAECHRVEGIALYALDGGPRTKTLGQVVHHLEEDSNGWWAFTGSSGPETAYIAAAAHEELHALAAA